MGNSYVVWKVIDKNSYFKPVSKDHNEWAEYVGSEKVSSLKLISKNDQKVILRKDDGSVLEFNSEKVFLCNQLYTGTWTNQENALNSDELR